MVIQLLVLTYYLNKEYYPTNASLTYDTIKGILELNALPKDQILDFILKSSKDKILPNDGLVSNLGVMGAALTFILIVLAILFILRHFMSKGKMPRMQRIVN